MNLYLNGALRGFYLEVSLCTTSNFSYQWKYRMIQFLLVLHEPLFKTGNKCGVGRIFRIG